ncbi:hypothetical protein [Anaeromyxobacter paludicola]|uniref:Uncharacterized protein n=1 Tax=Anaeromyxobacter paludicola TaxID=2918171 RepID=A0ABN6N8A3_9BACT|nr:hypothetical protein [Anaeromyxobacter paludicola]BDG08220.1 hypothetical protein AMPC_13330 [Anaeromyxobacter paludicola]
MDGPNAEASRLRKPAVVFDLAAYRNALLGCDFVTSTLGGAPWVLGVVVRWMADGSPRLVIRTKPLSVLQRRCLPTSVCEVETVVEECG